MLYHHVFRYRSGVSAVSAASAFAELFSVRDAARRAACLTPRRRRAPSLWGLGAAAGLLSFPLRAWSSESDSGPDPDPGPDPELAGELCPAPIEGALLAPPESCDLPAEAASASHEPALLTVLGSDVRLEDLPGLPEQQEGLVLPQAPEGTAASGGGLFGVSWPVLALVGGGGLLAIALLASGGSDSDDGGSTSGSGDNGDNGGGGAMNATPAVVTTGAMAAPASLTATEGMAVSLDVSDWFSDPDAGDTLTYTAMGNPDWLVLDAMTGALTVAAMDEAEVGIYTLTVTATDDSAAMASITHTMTLTIEDSSPAPDGNGDSNEPPVTTTLALASLTATEEAAASWDVSDWFSDPDGDALTYAATGAPSWLTLNAMTGELTIAADATDDAEVGTYTFTLTATDDSAAMASVTHTVTLVIADDPDDGMVTVPDSMTPGPDGMTPAPGASNEAPTTTTLAETSLAVDEGAAESWDVTDWFDDPDGDALTYAVTGLPDGDWLVFDAAMGELTIAAGETDDAQVGSHTFTVTATDDSAAMASVTHTVVLEVANVNEAPTTTTDAPTAEAPLTVAEGMAASWTLADWFADPDTDDELTYTETGLPDWLELDDTKGELAVAAGDTDDAQVGPYTFTITATDPDDESAELKVTLTVENVNDAPAVVTGTMAPPATVTAMEGGAAQSFTLAAWFTDPDSGDTLAFTLGTGAPTWATFNAMTGVLSLAFNATDDADVGSHALEVIATDAGKLAVTHTVTVAVSNVADAPTVASGAPAMLTAMEGSATAMSWDVSTWFSDEDTALPSSPDVLTYTVSGNPEWLTFTSGVLTIAAFAADDAEIGTYVLEVTASDQEEAMASHMTTLTITDTENEPVVSAAMSAVLSNRIAPATGGMIELNLTDVFTDTNEEGDSSPAGELTFAISESIPGTGDDNIITAMLDGSMLTLTPGAASGFGQQETVTITVTDSNDKQTVAEFAVTTRANVLDTTELTPALGFIIQGDAAGDQLGWSVSGAGDVNGDGLADLIVGADEGDDKTTAAGEAYIIYGKANPAAGAAGTQFGTSVGSRQVLDTTSLTLADGFIIQGDMGEDHLGYSVSGAGDINGDGLADLIVGARWGDDGGANAGEAYIVYGKAGADGTQFGTAMTANSVMRQVLDTSSMAPADFFILLGDAASDRLGRRVSGAGDVNGDGIDDLIVGARYGDDGGEDAGEAYIIYGKPNPAAGDGTPGTQFGITGTGGRQVLDTSMLAPAAGFIIQGDAAGDQLGVSVSGAGDINGDGLADLIVGAESGGDGGSGAGEAYIVYGKVVTGSTQFGTVESGGTRRVVDTSMLAPAAGFILQGDAEFDNLSASVSGAGDINGDGRDDLIVGARFGDDGGDAAGEAYIIYGKAGDGTQFGMVETGGTRRVLDTSMLAPAAGFILQGDAEGDNLGYSVSGAGDINGDGLADLIAGAWLGDDGGEDAGEAYIIYGKAGTQFGMEVITAGVMRQVLDTTGLAPTDGFIIQGDTGDDQLGWLVSGAGDVNGDGFDDLIAGAFKGDDGGEDAGEAYVVYGGTHLGEVVSHAQTLVGMAVPTLPGNPSPAQQEAAAQAAFLHGGAGNDRLVAHADTTVLYGGAGDDVLVLVDWSFHRVDGGSGDDVLVLGMGVVLDFTLATVRGKVRGIETLSLSDGAEATLNLLSVYALVESRDNGGTHTDAGEAFLRIAGSSGMVSLSDDVASWTKTDEGTADLYTQGSAKLLIDDGVAVA